MNAAPLNGPAELPSNRRLVRLPFTPRTSLLVYHLLLIGASVGVYLAGGPPQGQLGIFLACAGAALIVCPPQIKIDWWLWLCAAGLVGCGALAFLPERWFGVPAWRQKLESVPALHLPIAVTPVPWETAFWLAVLALSLLAGLFLLAHPIRSAALLWCVTLAAVVCGVYAALAMYAKQTGWHYPWSAGASFGFFLNRNHTATFLVTGSMLALGLLGVVPSQRRWGIGVVAAASLAVCVSGLFFFSGSRGGVVFLLTGTTLWVAGLGRTWRNPRLLVSVAALLVASGVLFLVSGSEVRNRLLGGGNPPTTARPQDTVSPGTISVASAEAGHEAEHIPFDFRVLIYRDVASLLHDYPLTGTGLGVFAYDFAQYRQASLSEFAALHPESDWLMLAAEAGLPALVFAAGLVWLASRRLFRLTDHPFWPLRWGCAVAAGVAVLHGWVDVPAHRVVLGWWILVLAGMGLQVSRGSDERSRFQHGLFVLGGLGALVLGGQLIRAEWFGGPALPPFAAQQAEKEIVATFQRGDAFGAMTKASRAAAVSPMAATLYYQWGVLLLHFEESDAEAAAAFEAQRLLNPVWPEVPLWQGDAWAPLNAKRTAALWLEALDRQQRIQARKNTISDGGVDYFRGLLARGKKWPAVEAELGTAVDRSPAFALAWLDEADPVTAEPFIIKALTNETQLSRYSAKERERLLLLCDTKGDSKNVSRFLADHPDWQPAAWPLHLRQLVKAGLTEQAVHEAAEHYHLSLDLPSSTLDGQSSVMPRQGDDPVSLSKQYWQDGNPVAARRMLEVAADASGPQSPLSAEYWRLRAAVSAQDKAWDQAWQALERYIQLLNPAEILP